VALACLLAGASAAAQVIGPVDWSTSTEGTLGQTEVRLSSIAIFGPINNYFDASGPDYAVAPLALGSEFINYDNSSAWTANFSQPLQNVLLYVCSWRGNYSGVTDPPTTYTFDQTFTIVSGLGRVALSGSTLEFPDDSPVGNPSGFHSGIIQFPGPLTSLSVWTQNASSQHGAQLMTFAVMVPEPSVTGLLFTALLLFRFLRRR